MLKNKILIVLICFLVVLLVVGLSFLLNEKDFLNPDNELSGSENETMDTDEGLEESDNMFSQKHILLLSKGEIESEVMTFGENFGLAFTTVDLKAFTNYRIKIVLNEDKLDIFSSSCIPFFLENGVSDGYQVLLNTTFGSDDHYRGFEYGLYAEPSFLSEKYFGFLSESEGDTFLFAPFQLNTTDETLANEMAMSLMDCIVDIVIEEVI